MLDKMVSVLAGKDANSDLAHYMRVLSLFGVAVIANNVRSKVQCPTDFSTVPANVYGIAIAGSGLSKSRSLRYIEELFIKDALIEIKAIAEQKMEDIDPFDMEGIAKLIKEGVTISPIYKSATDSAISAIRSMMDTMDIYSVNIALDEMGSVLAKEYDMLSDTLLNAFDHGVIKPNLRRTTGVKAASKPVPHNMMMFGSPTLIFEGKAETEKLFFDLLGAGMARRNLFAMVTSHVNHYTLVNEGATAIAINEISACMTYIATNYHNRVLELDDEAKRLYIESEIKGKEDSELVSKYKPLNMVYTQNKHWLALKISALIAMMDMKQQVEAKHFNEAMAIVEESFESLKLINSRPEKYELIVDWLCESNGEESEYTLTQELPFYADIKSKKAFWELAKGYAYQNNITLQIEDRQNITFYQARGKTATDLTEPLIFSYSADMTTGYTPNEIGTWTDMHKVTQSDGLCYSAHRFKNGYRNKDNVITSFSLLMLDVDGGTTLDMAKIILSDYTYLISTTRNHQKEKNGIVCDRFRIIMPMEYTLDLTVEQYSNFMKNIMEDLPIELDRQCTDASRFFYGASGEYWYNEGILINCDKYVSNTGESETYRKAGSNLSKKNIGGISQYIIRNQHGGRNSALIKLALLLMDTGYTHDEAKDEILRVNKQFDNPLTTRELEKTIFKTIERKEEKEVDDYSDDEYVEEGDPFAETYD
jgi:hypothetical protein